MICQLGSTVATSLVDAESKPKHCLLLEIHRDSFRTTPIPLRSVR